MTRRTPLALCLTAAALLAGCGGSDTKRPSTPRGPASAELRAQLAAATKVRPGDFPPVAGRTLQQVADSLDGAGPELAFATQTLTPGPERRLAFGVIDPKSGFVYAPTVIYLARNENDRAQGPFPAPADLLVTDPPYRSRTAASEKDPFAAIYETTVPFEKPGAYRILAVSKINGQNVGGGSQVTVKPPREVGVPDIGQRAPRTTTDTRTAAGGDIKAIDTRLPPDDMHDTNLADALGKRPIALLFATPQLCQSRVCGPVVDIAAQLKATYGDRMAFIHQEVYVDNQVDKGIRPPLRAFGLQTEPWLFVIDRDGRVTARLEGSFGFRAFEQAIKSGL